MIRSVLRWHLVVAILTVLSGCAGSPKVSFYTLNAPSYPETGSGASALPTILLGPVTLPEMVDRPQLVIRTGDNQVAIVDTSRWAQSLKSEVARALAANLAHDVGTLRVFLAGQGMSIDPDMRVAVDVLNFESRPGTEVTIEARWAIRRKGESAPLTGRSFARETVRGEGHELLVAAHGRALARISQEIAGAIRNSGSARDDR